MRFLVLSLVAIAALVLGPRVDLGVTGNAAGAAAVERIEETVLRAGPNAGGAERGLSLGASAQALVHLPYLRNDTMPILPDVPERVALLAQDAAPGPDLRPRPDVTALLKARASPEAAPIGAEEVKAVVPLRSAGKFVTPPKAGATVIGNRLALRTGPAKRYPSVAALSRGTKVRITGQRQGGYIPVQIASSGQAGWVFHSYVRRGN